MMNYSLLARCLQFMQLIQGNTLTVADRKLIAGVLQKDILEHIKQNTR